KTRAETGPVTGGGVGLAGGRDEPLGVAKTETGPGPPVELANRWGHIFTRKCGAVVRRLITSGSARNAVRSKKRRGTTNANRTAQHHFRPVNLCGDWFQIDDIGDPQSRWFDRVPARKCRSAPVLVAGRLRRAGPEVF